ncbi:MAG: DUF1304 domain-containing protein [Mycobacteriaceae bacterium]
MPVLTQIFAALAALLHVLIFVMESVLWERRPVWKRFGLASQEDAATTKSLAYNQGFYNLFLAIGIAVGLVIGGAAGTALVVFCCFSIVAAAVVIVTGGSQYLRAGLIQGITPTIALIALWVF